MELYKNRPQAHSPIPYTINNKEIFYITQTPLEPKDSAFDRMESIKYYTLVHSFMLKEYDLEGFRCSNGATILDLGAADGDTMIFFRTLYPNSPIYPFECSDLSFEFIHKNIAINHFNNIYPQKYAIYKRSGKAYFDSNFCLVEKPGENSIEVDCISVDDFIKQNNIENLGLIKLDIEGGEQDALIGARESILQYKPIIMVPIYHLPSDIDEIPKFFANLDLPYEFRIRWTEKRVYGVDCVMFVKFI